jgi:hypothetical protein
LIFDQPTQQSQSEQDHVGGQRASGDTGAGLEVVSRAWLSGTQMVVVFSTSLLLKLLKKRV